MDQVGHALRGARQVQVARQQVGGADAEDRDGVPDGSANPLTAS